MIFLINMLLFSGSVVLTYEYLSAFQYTVTFTF